VNWREMQDMAKELFGKGMEPMFLNGSLLAVHAEMMCHPPCAIHNPSDHPMVELPLVWRSDRGFFERRCRHGVGHPDPDDLAFKERTLGREASAFGVHGCCGVCCREN